MGRAAPPGASVDGERNSIWPLLYLLEFRQCRIQSQDNSSSCARRFGGIFCGHSTSQIHFCLTAPSVVGTAHSSVPFPGLSFHPTIGCLGKNPHALLSCRGGSHKMDGETTFHLAVIQRKELQGFPSFSLGRRTSSGQFSAGVSRGRKVWIP